MAVGFNGTILSSTDGVSWTYRNNTCRKHFRDVAYGNAKFLAVADDGNFGKSDVFVSSNGVDWFNQGANLTNSLAAIAFGNGVFAGVGVSRTVGLAGTTTSGGVAVSKDGVIWTSENSDVFYYTIAFAQNIFIASADFKTSISTDGFSWTTRTSFMTPVFSEIGYGAGVFVGVGNQNRATSPDGTNWTLNGFPSLGNRALAFGNGVFVAAGPANNLTYVSKDGLNWKTTSFSPTQNINDLVFGNGLFVAVGDTGLILSSPDGATWNTHDPGSFISRVNFVNSMFVGLSGSNVVTSIDGLEWKAGVSANTKKIRDVIYANNLFVGVGDNGTILTSLDARSWDTRISGVTNDLLAITYANRRFFAVGRQGRVVTSTSGFSWESDNVGRTDNDLNAVTFGNDTFLALGNAGRFFASPDGFTWFNIYQGISKLAVAYGNGLFVAVSDSGNALLSGIITPRIEPTISTMNSFKYLTLTYTRLKSMSGTNYSVAVSRNLIDWDSSAGLTTGIATNDLGATEQIVVRDNTPVNSASERFMRVSLKLPPGVVITSLSSNVELLPPIIVLQPQSQTLTAGEMATFVVGATGTPPLSYQWRFNGAEVEGATNSTFTITKAQPTNAGTYSVAVKNSAGDVTSHIATLDVTLPLVGPTILEQPESRMITTGESANFVVVASGTLPLIFQWRKDGANITGATNASFAVPNAKLTDSGKYSVIVRNSVGSAVSAEATLNVNLPAPNIRINFHPVGSVGGYGTNNGSFRYPQGLAVGPNGELHVVDNTNRRIQVFDVQTLTFKRQYGNSVFLPTNLQRYPIDIAVDSSGRAFVSEYGDRLHLFDASGNLIRSFSTSVSSGVLVGYWATGVAVDPKTGNIVVGMAPTSSSSISIWTPTGALVSNWSTPENGSYDVWVSTTGEIFAVGWTKILQYDVRGGLIAGLPVSGSVTGITGDEKGVLYLARYDTNQVEAYSQIGQFLGTYDLPIGVTPAQPYSGHFYGLAYSSLGFLFAIDRVNHKVLKLSVERTNTSSATTSP